MAVLLEDEFVSALLSRAFILSDHVVVNSKSNLLFFNRVTGLHCRAYNAGIYARSYFVLPGLKPCVTA